MHFGFENLSATWKPMHCPIKNVHATNCLSVAKLASNSHPQTRVNLAPNSYEFRLKLALQIRTSKSHQHCFKYRFKFAHRHAVSWFVQTTQTPQKRHRSTSRSVRANRGRNTERKATRLACRGQKASKRFQQHRAAPRPKHLHCFAPETVGVRAMCPSGISYLVSYSGGQPTGGTRTRESRLHHRLAHPEVAAARTAACEVVGTGEAPMGSRSQLHYAALQESPKSGQPPQEPAFLLHAFCCSSARAHTKSGRPIRGAKKNVFPLAVAGGLKKNARKGEALAISGATSRTGSVLGKAMWDMEA